MLQTYECHDFKGIIALNAIWEYIASKLYVSFNGENILLYNILKYGKE